MGEPDKVAVPRAAARPTATPTAVITAPGRDLPAIAAELAAMRRLLAVDTSPEPSRLTAARADLELALANLLQDQPRTGVATLTGLLDELEQLCSALVAKRDGLGLEIQATAEYRRACSAYRGHGHMPAARP